MRLLTDQVERESRARVFELQHRTHCAAMAVSEKPQESWDNAQAMVNKVVRELMPWAKVATKDDMRRQILDNWVAVYGDPSDPEVAERSRQTALALVREANAAIRKAMGGG